ncbi:DUF7665 family protein [Actinomadura alba]|uniref:DUF7665 family protein n=1 Tax=Actinomadura alba TaxID=406431 RepID=UPI003CD0B083
MVSLNWPHATIAVAAAHRPDSPHEFHLRFELTGYPQDAPTVSLWNPIGRVAHPRMRGTASRSWRRLRSPEP